jgi:hypothetical protein
MFILAVSFKGLWAVVRNAAKPREQNRFNEKFMAEEREDRMSSFQQSQDRLSSAMSAGAMY